MYRVKLIIGVLFMLSTLLVSPTTFAADPTPEPQFYIDNDIIFYDANASDNTCADGLTSVSIANLKGKNNLEKVFNYMKGKGLSDIQAAGVVGNVAEESGGDPTIIQGGGHTKDPSGITAGWGLIQWTPGTKVIAAAKGAGVTTPIYELASQLDILWGHMNNKPPITTGKFTVKEYKKITDLSKAVEYFEENIEAAGEPRMLDRIASAKLALGNFGTGESSAATASAGVLPLNDCEGVGDGAVAGSVVETALNYAWKDYHKPNYLDLKPAYAKAISKAQGEGKYVGGGIHPGVDCGGFVTRVMQDSGADTKYGGGGNTTSQLSYLVASGKYTELKNPTTGDLKPGDIAIKTDGGGHTYMFVGNQPNFETQVASSSYSPSNTQWRSPMAGHEAPADPEYRWFTLKNTVEV